VTVTATAERLSLPTCPHRGGVLPSGRYYCASEAVISPRGVTAEFCAGKCLPAWRTAGDGEAKAKICRGCLGEEEWPEQPAQARYEWITTAQCADDTAKLLLPKLPPNLAGVVAVPRSGMLPAAVLATHLHLPLLTLDGAPRPVGSGHRGRVLQYGGDQAGPMLVVDDTCYGGGAMGRARAMMDNRPALYAAVYVRPEVRHVVNYFARLLPSPHLLEWNAFNNGPFAGFCKNKRAYRGGVATDLDGIICHDEHSGGPKGEPLWLPRTHPAKLIVTGRVETYRPGTESWLRRWGVRWQRLEMFPAGEPWSEMNAAAFKARHFKASPLGFFVESCPRQAQRIFELAGKPVICPIMRRVYQ
jgi:orotate phosphoribosyltransferase